MSEEITSSRIEKANLFLPFTPSLTEAYDTQPTFRVVLDVSESSAMGYLQSGYYIKLNESLYFIRKKAISVFTNSQTERVLEYLKKQKHSLLLMFTEIKHSAVISSFKLLTYLLTVGFIP
jgi:hypothetical protein